LDKKSRELKFILQTLNPFLHFSEPKEEVFTGLDEQKLIQILKKSKVFSKFSKKLDSQPNFAERFLSAYPKLKKLNEELKSRQISELNEFLKISKLLAREEVHLLLIKSAGEFPHESSNFDCLIEPDKLAICDRILRDEGYQELPITREPHKFLYRKIATPKNLPLHIHTRVEWEAAEFADAKKLRKRARPFINKETGALVPSIEDSILITVAHYFFEDHEIKVYDLLKLWELSREREPDWDYMFNEAAELGWSDAFALNLQLLNRMSACCFGRKAFPELDKPDISKQAQLALKTVTFDSLGKFNIPYGVSALFFLRKVFQNPHFSFYQKSRHVDYVLSDILRRRVIGYIEI
jgi:hypothetical protein